MCMHGCVCFLYIFLVIDLLYICLYAQPYGFDVGQSERGSVLKGLDIGVKGMRVGGQVRSSFGIKFPRYVLKQCCRIN